MDYKELPDHSKVWVYQADRTLSEGEVLQIRSKADDFVSTWASHGTDLRAAIDVFYNRFLVIMVDEEHAQATGCSIDGSVGLVKELEQDYNINFLNRLIVAWREGDAIESCMLDQFERKLQAGELSDDTIVFNNLVSTKSEFESKWEVPVKDSWHFQLV